MTIRGILSLGAAVLRHPRLSLGVLQRIRRAGASSAPVSDSPARLAADWLLEAQRNCPDGPGYSRRYRPAFGWDRGYVETTGYIIPTLLTASKQLNEPRYRNSALVAGEWLLGKQNPDGSFSEIDHGTPQAFDTGQVLLGLIALAREYAENQAYATAANRAARWLANTLNPDGTWTTVAFAGAAHTYYARCGAALLAAGQLLGVDAYTHAGRRHLEWVLGRQRESGWFDRCEFEIGRPALLHTIVYVMEGLLDAYAVERDNRYLVAAEQSAAGLLAASRTAPEGIPVAYYMADWLPTSSELCVTGLAQWAGVCRRLVVIQGNSAWSQQADLVIAKLCRLQILQEGPLRGALPNVVPWTGSYGKMGAFNWNAKFFIDALLVS